MPGNSVFRGENGKCHNLRWLAPIGLLLLGLWLVPLSQTCRLSCVPGDLGDARFNGLILEYFYRWLRGVDAGLVSPGFFYPMPGALAFSDNHWGTAWVYTLFRLLGQDQYRAFDLWYITGCALNFVACNWVLRRLNFSPLAGAVGAFAFAFAMPVIAKSGHAQLTYRFMVPLGMLFWFRFSESGRWRWFGWLTFAVAAQFYMSIYLGYFLALLVVALVVAQFLLDRHQPIRWLNQWKFLSADVEARKDVALGIGFSVVSFVAVLCLLMPYLHFSRLYGFHRATEEVASMLPRVRSYLLADNSAIWRAMSAMFVGEMPMRHEQQMFFGVGILGLALIGWRSLRSPLCGTIGVSILLLVALTLSVGGHSFYALIAGLPGVNSIRAVSRIGLVLIMPLAVLVAAGVDIGRQRGGLWSALVGLLIMLMIAESATLRTGTYDIGEAQGRIAALRGQLPTTLAKNALVFVPSQAGVPFFISELDGMGLAQSVNRATLNGYSGNQPAGYNADPDRAPCMQAISRLRAAALFYQDRLHAPLPEGVNGPLAIPSHPECASFNWQPLPMVNAADVKVRILSLQPECGQYRVRVLLENDSTYALMASPSVRPTRLSWQKVAKGRGVDPAAWWPRIELGRDGDLPAGKSREIQFAIPMNAGDDGDLIISMVIEGQAWLHDAGMRLASYPLRASRACDTKVQVIEHRISE